MGQRNATEKVSREKAQKAQNNYHPNVEALTVYEAQKIHKAQN